MRHCNKKCKILKFVEEEPCPILDFRKTRIESNWYFEKDGEKFIPLCEDGETRTYSRKERVML